MAGRTCTYQVYDRTAKKAPFTKPCGAPAVITKKAGGVVVDRCITHKEHA